MNQAMKHTDARIKLRAWQETDLPFLMQLRNNVSLQAQLLATARGSDEGAVRAWLRQNRLMDRLIDGASGFVWTNPFRAWGAVLQPCPRSKTNLYDALAPGA